MYNVKDQFRLFTRKAWIIRLFSLVRRTNTVKYEMIYSGKYEVKPSERKTNVLHGHLFGLEGQISSYGCNLCN